MSFIWQWNISGALHISNHSLVKQNSPYGVVKVSGSLDFVASVIC